MNEKARTIAKLEEDWQSIKELFDQVPTSKMEEPGVIEGWSVKDLMGHMTTWERVSIDRVQRLKKGKEIVRPYTNLDVFNAQEIEKKRNLSLHIIKRHFIEVHQRLVQVLQDLPDYFFLPETKTSQPVSPITFKHFQQHSEDLKRWLNN